MYQVPPPGFTFLSILTMQQEWKPDFSVQSLSLDMGVRGKGNAMEEARLDLVLFSPWSIYLYYYITIK